MKRFDAWTAAKSAQTRRLAKIGWVAPTWATTGPIPPNKECQYRQMHEPHTAAPCGLPSKPGRSFCEAHCRLVYQPRKETLDGKSHHS